MKKTVALSVVVLMMGLNSQVLAKSESSHTVALIVQNHAAPDASVPMVALTDALTAKLAGKGFKVINPYNVVGENENRTQIGEALPEASATELAQGLGAQGVLTASVIELLDTTIGNPAVCHQYVIRLAFNLADASTGATVCGETIKVKSRQYTIAQHNANRAEYLGDLMYSAADQCAEMLKKKAASWEPTPALKPAANPPPKVVGRDDLGVVDLGHKTPQTPQEKIKAPPPPAANADFTIFDFESFFRSLAKAMLANARFKENYQAMQTEKAKRPIVIIGAVTNKSVGAFAQSYGDLLAAIPDLLRTELGEAQLDEGRIFDTKDDDMSKMFAERILVSDKSPVEDSALMEALKQHGSPDFVIVGDVRLFAEPAQRKTCRFHLALHSLYTGKIVWEGMVTAIK